MLLEPNDLNRPQVFPCSSSASPQLVPQELLNLIKEEKTPQHCGGGGWAVVLPSCALRQGLYRTEAVPLPYNRTSSTYALMGEGSREPCSRRRFPAACAPASPRAPALLRLAPRTRYVVQVGRALQGLRHPLLFLRVESEGEPCKRARDPGGFRALVAMGGLSWRQCESCGKWQTVTGRANGCVFNSCTRESGGRLSLAKFSFLIFFELLLEHHESWK